MRELIAREMYGKVGEKSHRACALQRRRVSRYTTNTGTSPHLDSWLVCIHPKEKRVNFAKERNYFTKVNTLRFKLPCSGIPTINHVLGEQGECHSHVPLRVEELGRIRVLVTRAFSLAAHTGRGSCSVEVKVIALPSNRSSGRTPPGQKKTVIPDAWTWQ